jgi:16S rRNA (cytosine1402-N4)-methyltransferase
MIHTSVLSQEVIDGLDIQDDDTVIDATLGNGGHSESILRLGKKIKVIGIDLDPEAIVRSKDRLKQFSNITFVQDSFRNLDAILQNLHVSTISKALFDFGLSSNQLEESGRGFSFQKDEPLLMTFGKEHKSFTAQEIVNDWDEENIRHVIRGYGEERFAGRIAKAIVKARQIKPITTTAELVKVILSTCGGKVIPGKIHPATKTFQALRITVNDELGAIQEGLTKAFSVLAPNGRIIAISFHSLEDRIVKQMFRAWSDTGFGIQVTKKPIIPQDEEIRVNPRSRSAKLRIIQKK